MTIEGAIVSSNKEVARLGFEPRKLQLLWRDNPPKTFNETEAYAAVIEALVHEGIDAWCGDGTGCVVQMLRAQYKRWEKAVVHATKEERLKWEAETKLLKARKMLKEASTALKIAAHALDLSDMDEVARVTYKKIDSLIEELEGK